MASPFPAWTDPSENVKALSEAASKRQDDLRDESRRYFENNLGYVLQIIQIRAEHATEITRMHGAHALEMRTAESARLDSIRQVDVTAVRTEASRALEAIQTLAATSARDAETLRNLVNTTALSTAAGTADTVKQIVERIAALERSSYEGVGKQRVADPMMENLLIEVKALQQARSQTTGHGQGIGTSWHVFALAASLLVSVISAGTVVLTRTSAPQVIYAQPAPAPH
jgi:hypothetical protein